jgi:hypothetical protein
MPHDKECVVNWTDVPDTFCPRIFSRGLFFAQFFQILNQILRNFPSIFSGKLFLETFFPRKIFIFPIIFGRKICAEFSVEKNYEKSAPGAGNHYKNGVS